MTLIFMVNWYQYILICYLFDEGLKGLLGAPLPPEDDDCPPPPLKGGGKDSSLIFGVSENTRQKSPTL